MEEDANLIASFFDKIYSSISFYENELKYRYMSSSKGVRVEHPAAILAAVFITLTGRLKKNGFQKNVIRVDFFLFTVSDKKVTI